MFSGMLNKIMGIGLVVLGAAAAFFKWRAGVNEKKAERQRRRADGLQTKMDVKKKTKERQDEITEEFQTDREEIKGGKKGGLDKWAIVLVLFLAGCASEPKVISPECDIPPRPSVPTVAKEELEPLPQDVKERVLIRDSMIREYAEKLEAACDEVNSAAQG